MKKKALSTLLAVSMVAGMVTGCGSSADQTAASTDTATGAGIYDDCIFHLPCYSCISWYCPNLSYRVWHWEVSKANGKGHVGFDMPFICVKMM